MNLEPLHNALTAIMSFVAGPTANWSDLVGDDGTGLLMPALAGIAAATTVALTVTIYFQTGYRSYRDMIGHGLVAAIAMALLAFAILDMRNVALAHIARMSIKPGAQFELQWQQTTERARALAAQMGSSTRSLSDAHQG
ncbi:MAG TPA: hypothetical protein VFL62_02825 [Bradyrhizobium sp.]|uniref:hypothetical protein n=1 Tax=Bradyrhizobium sp. TaxID=376 RepID=UPI002D7F1A32|nr:hypothetical protein [Bradyrhizobium sp.]HET7885139.1 hypothetical protein [Bradyrhizobium sp.]